MLPSTLLLDEPLSALDARTRASGQRELAAVLRETGVPAVLVTHDFAEAATLGNDVAILDDGHILQRGNPAAVAAQPASSFVGDFIGAVVLHGTAHPTGNGLTAVELDGGARVASTDRPRAPSPSALSHGTSSSSPPAFRPAAPPGTTSQSRCRP